MAATRITPAFAAWVAQRRADGAPWKVIMRECRDQGMPDARVTLWRALKHLRRGQCSEAADKQAA